ncbi:polyketide biosynthesis acyl carrier protein [Streptomyces zhaozhouensis]|uniref:Polyketide biosynthesis acyl carrier protein n=1 Tax=Streptomyces zhaozhouensis TaxID=1300267 RepID=A0A286E079_9ACTN|nr:phosphopantetheine-binding protein [Streptomyces zhaozhouensis]SOD64270.1 polyketide biosynthesis acyl carrier protein [Streptomyces zhaozhouensis]
MASSEIFETLSRIIQEILPEVKADDITPETSLRDLGANSVDRMDIISETLEEHELRVSMLEFGELSSLGELAEAIEKKRVSAA